MARMWVRVEALRGAIERLVAARIHNNFPGYLAVLRAAAAERRSTNLVWDSGEYFRTFFAVRGGPKTSSGNIKPFYRPMDDENVTPYQCWYNKNTAGSYAQSSIRKQLREVVEVTGSRSQTRYSLREKHWELAAQHLLRHAKPSAIDLAAFLYRDYCIEKDGVVSVADLVSIFRDEFGLTSSVRETGDVEFAHLFTDESVDAITGEWLEDVP